MNLSDQVRDLFYRNYITPARLQRRNRVDVAVRDLNRLLSWSQRYPLICSALAARSYHNLLGVELVAATDPCPSSTTVFSFAVR